MNTNNKKKMLSVFIAMLMLFAMAPVAMAALVDFPLIAINGDMVADANTRYVAEFEQNHANKLITAKIKIENGSSGTGAKPLIINGVSLQITFSSKVSLYRYDPLTDGSNHTYDASRKYAGGFSDSAAEFAKYCKTPDDELNILGSTALQSDGNGGYIGTRITTASGGKTITIAPGSSVTVAMVFFMPNNGSELIDIDMFTFQYLDRTVFPSLKLIKLTTFIANGTNFMYANARASTPTETYVESPSSFKMHIKRPIPNVSANNATRTVTGYDAVAMEWSHTAGGPFVSKAPSASDVGSGAKTIYVRYKGSEYIGDDVTYGNYKKYLPGDAVAVTFGEGNAQVSQAVPSLKKTGVNLTSTDGKNRVGDIIKYTITASNIGSDGSVWANAILSDQINEYVIFDENDDKNVIASGIWAYETEARLFTAELGNILKGQAKTVSFQVKIADNAYGKQITNTVAVNGKDGNGLNGGDVALTVDEDGGDRSVEPASTNPPEPPNPPNPPPPVVNYFSVTFYSNYAPETVVAIVNNIPGGSSAGASNMPSNPVRNGFAFIGWNTAMNGTGSGFTAATRVYNNMQVYAQWRSYGDDGYVNGNDVLIGDQGPPLVGFLTDHVPYIGGYPDNTVRPGNAITRAEVAMIFFRLLSSNDKHLPTTTAFSDAVPGAWYAQAVNYLARIDILNGYPDGTFRPNRPITRGEFAAVASRFDNLFAVDTNAFPDIAGHWAREYINSAYVKGWVNGYADGTFRPQQNITRAEVVKVVNTMLDRKIRPENIPADVRFFTDIVGHWAFADIVEASNEHDYFRRSDGYETWVK